MPKGISILARPLALALCGAGAWLCGELLRHQAGLWGSAPARGVLGRACAAASGWGFDCSASAADAATVPLPLPTWSAAQGFGLRRGDVPVSFAGLAYFVVLGCWLVFVGLPRRGGPRWTALPAWTALAAGIASIGFLGAMLAGRAPLCLTCVLVQAASLGLCAILWPALRRAATPPGAAAPQLVPAWRLASQAMLFAIILVTGLGLFRREQLALGGHVRALRPYRQIVENLRADEAFLVREYFAQPQHAELVGRTDLPELVVFTDFACPACICTAGRVQELIAPAFGGRLLVQFRHFPLDDRCNPHVAGRPHPTACLAAAALEAAREQVNANVLEALHGPLYAAAPTLDAAGATGLAARAGLDVTRFARDLERAAIAQRVRDDVALGHAVGVTGTPVVFLNGRLVGELAADNPLFWNAIAAELAASPAETLAASEGPNP